MLALDHLMSLPDFLQRQYSRNIGLDVSGTHEGSDLRQHLANRRRRIDHRRPHTISGGQLLRGRLNDPHKDAVGWEHYAGRSWTSPPIVSSMTNPTSLREPQYIWKHAKKKGGLNTRPNNIIDDL